MDKNNMAKEIEIITLHRYFIWSDRMRVHFETILKNKKTMNGIEFDFETFLYLSSWYGLMYVVIEGWIKLDLHDPQIDSLLESAFVDTLRRYRNGVFHYQRNYFDRRFKEFIEGKEKSAKWIRELRNEFSRYFLNRIGNNN